MCGGDRPRFCDETDDAARQDEQTDRENNKALAGWAISKMVSRMVLPVARKMMGVVGGDMIFPNEAHAPTGNPDNLKWRNPDNPDEWCSDKEGCGPWVTPIHPRDSDPRCKRKQ